MDSRADYQKTVDALRNSTGIVIPVYVPGKVEARVAHDLIEETVRAYVREVEAPESVCLSADGDGPGASVAKALASEYKVRVVSSERNQGKLGALRLGVACLLDSRDFQYVAAADQDGDHFANELLNFVRAAQHAQSQAGTDRIMVLGRRISRHRPMGFLRGELEELADRILLDALQYDAAVTGNPLPLQYATTLDEFPDFHSGYKLFTKATAEHVFLTEPNRAGMSEEAYSRHAVEAVITVEAIKSGALLVVVNRSTLDEQPVSAFGQLNRCRLFVDKIVCPCKRLGIPAHFVAQWLDNHMPRLLLGTLTPQGKQEILDIRRGVLEAMGGETDATESDEVIHRPRFI